MMLDDRRKAFQADFREKVRGMRIQIDALPNELRPHLHTMLDDSERACSDLQEKVDETCDIADDLVLAATYGALHVEATWREITQSFEP